MLHRLKPNNQWLVGYTDTALTEWDWQGYKIKVINDVIMSQQKENFIKTHLDVVFLKRFLNSSTHWSVTSQSLDSGTDKLQLQQSQNTKQLNLTKKQTNLVQWRWNCFADCMTMDTSGNSSTDTRLIRDIYCGPEVLFDLVLPWNSWWWWWWWHSMRKQSESNPTRNYSSQTSNAANKN